MARYAYLKPEMLAIILILSSGPHDRPDRLFDG